MASISLLVAMLLLVTLAQTQPALIDSVTPAFAGIQGRETVQVTGYGFHTYSYAQCIWGDRWLSPLTEIQSDNLVTCETPVFAASDLASGFPFTTKLKVIFDGFVEYSASIELDFQFGPSLTSISPTSSVTSGGVLITLTGTGFNQYDFARVDIDGNPCSNVVVLSSTQIQCLVPPGQFNRDAKVTLRFDNQFISQLTAPQTFHYGPVVTRVYPPCGNVLGSTLVTLYGDNFDDPLIDPLTFPSGNFEVVSNLGGGVIASTVGTLANGVITFFTPPTSAPFGTTVSFTVYFKTFNSRVAVFSDASLPSITYGPSVSTISSTSGHRGGGDRITISGCGLSYLTRTQVSVDINVGGTQQPLCFRGAGAGTPGDSLQIISNGFPEQDTIQCTTNSFECQSGLNLNREVTVFFSNTAGSFRTPVSTALQYATGPQVTTISPNRGSFAGGDTISIIGTNFFSSSTSKGWAARVRFSSTLMGGAVVTRNANIINDTLITVVTPSVFKWGENTLVDVDFVSSTNGLVLCGNIPRATLLVFTFGPSCTSIIPSQGTLTGGEVVTLTGTGFTKGRLQAASNTNIQICIQRLNPSLTTSGCSIWEPVSTSPLDSFTFTDNEITFKIPDIRKSVNTTVGGNRLFNDVAQVLLSFTDVTSAQVAASQSGNFLSCGFYTFGPQVIAITPNVGPNGPRAPFSPAQAVTVSGNYFTDPLYSKNVRIDIGTLATTTASIVTPTSTNVPVITSSTLWGGVAGSVDSVSVVFDTCNSTMSSTSITWGPVITGVISPTSSTSQTTDVYGLNPNGGQAITVVGQGFDEFAAARCVIDGVPQVATGLTATQIICVTPARAFGTVAKVSVQFGTICNPAAQVTSSTRWDWSNTLVAQQQLRYTPRIVSFTPNIGLTSGNTAVTINGEGFSGWPNYVCYFGEYANGAVAASVSSDGTQVQCSTPPQRGEFNTDVTVHVLLSTDANKRSWKVVAPAKFHYGPRCLSVVPTLGRLAGNEQLTINGVGFQDCIESNSTTPIIRNCTFVNFRVNFYDASSNSLVAHSTINSSLSAGFTSTSYLTVSPPATACQQKLRVELEYMDPLVTNDTQRFIQCPGVSNSTSAAFSYGPVFVSQSSQYFRNGISYGWQGMAVTFTGLNFHDPTVWTSDSNIQCLFGNNTGTLVGATSDTQIVCSAPDGVFNQLEQITIVWSGATLSCQGSTALKVGKFHWGPVIDAINPKFGYVAGGTPATISGFALDCCGITSIRCLFPVGETPLVSSSTSTSATCNIPANTFIDRQINNIGLGFSSPLFNSTLNNTASLVLTEAGTSITYYYGPLITNVAPVTNVRLSGLQSITITGVGFLDPYFTGVLCDFYAEVQGSIGTVPSWTSANMKTVSGAVTDTQIICPPRTYAHQCGAIDRLRVRFTRNCPLICGFRSELGANYIKTVAPPLPTAAVVDPFYTDAGSSQVIETRIAYGVGITSVTSMGNSLLRFPTSGGGTVVVTGTNFGDWVSGKPTLDFGTEKALCLFGDRRSAAPAVIDAATNSVTCTVPPGAFGLTGTVGLILDPKIASSQPNFFWTAHAVSISQDWGVPGNRDVIVVKGAGFCAYLTAVCVFGDDVSGRVEALASKIVDDRTVECTVPDRTPGVMALEIKLCAIGFCTPSLFDTVTVTKSFTVVGVTGISPSLVPACAQTSVSLSGFGFSRFDNFACVIRGQTVTATYVNDQTIVCSSTPILPLNDIQHLMTCANVALYVENRSRHYTLKSSSLLQYGVPEIISVSPTTSDIDDLTRVTVIARHLQGADTFGTYRCKFGSFQVNGQIQTQSVLVGTVMQTQQVVQCVAPTRSVFASLTVGTVPFEVQFNCFDTRGVARYTTSNLAYTFTQTPSVTSISPVTGTELGATEVTFFGNNLQGGSSYLCAFGDQVVSGTYIANGIAQSRGSPVVVCYTPALQITRATPVEVKLSIDGGNSYVDAPQRFVYDFALIECNEFIVGTDYSASGSSSNSGGAIVTMAWAALIGAVVVAAMMF